MSGAARFFQALGDGTRLALLEELRSGGRTVSGLVEALGCPQPKVSRHLKILKEVGLVRDRREGRNVTYELASAPRWGKEARDWVHALGEGLPLREPARAPKAGEGGEAPIRAAAPRAPRADEIETHLL
jgi:DNA-binding transcriptional ArsR family regulator